MFLYIYTTHTLCTTIGLAAEKTPLPGHRGGGEPSGWGGGGCGGPCSYIYMALYGTIWQLNNGDHDFRSISQPQVWRFLCFLDITWPDLGFSGSPTPSGRAEDQVGERSPKSSLSAHGQGQKVPATWAWIAGRGGWIGIKKSLDTQWFDAWLGLTMTHIFLFCLDLDSIPNIQDHITFRSGGADLP